MIKYIYRYGWYIARAYWYFRRPSTRGSCAIVQKDKTLLLVRHTYGHRDYWYFPGGGIKRGEDPKAAGERELKEEVGLSLRLKYLGKIHGTEDWRSITDDYFLGNALDAEVDKDNKEIAEYRWWPMDNIPDSLSPLSKLAAKKFLGLDV